MTAECIEISGEEAEALLARVKSSLPDEDYRLIKGLNHEALTAGENMTHAQRLHFHQGNSGPLMADLHRWLPWNYKENFSSAACQTGSGPK